MSKMKSRKKDKMKGKPEPSLLQKEFSRTPFVYRNGIQAWVRMAVRPFIPDPKNTVVSPPPETEEPYLFIQFPASMTQQDKIKGLRRAENDLSNSVATIPTNRALEGVRIIQQAKDNELNAALHQALTHIHQPDDRILADVQKLGWKKSGPTVGYSNIIKKRDRWMRQRFKIHRKKGIAPNDAIDLIRGEVKKEKFGSYRAPDLSFELTRKIVYRRS